MLKPYESCKETNIPWLEEVPSHWEIGRISSLFVENKNRNLDLAELNALQFKFGEIVQKKKFEADEELIKTFSKYNVVNVGDIMINGLNLNYDFLTKRVALVKQKGIMTSAYISLTPRRDFYSGFYTYLFKYIDERKVFNGLGSGIRLTLDYSELKKQQVVIPSRSEQEQIVKYLDWQNTKINKLMDAKKQQMELLKEQRQAVIDKAVTKGLDDTVAMKDSGVEWIGEVPTAFDTYLLRRVIQQIDSGTSVNSQNTPVNQSEIGVLSTSCVYGCVFDSQKNKKVESDEVARVTCPVKANTVIVSRMNTPELVGSSGYSSCDIKNLFLPDRLWQVAFVNDVNPRFIAMFLSSSYIRKYFSYIATGSSNTMKNLSQQQFMSTPVCIPSLDIQSEIVEYVERKLSVLDKTLQIMMEELDLLDEYKTSLISSVVTGKVDVRDVVVPEFEIVENEFLKEVGAEMEV